MQITTAKLQDSMHELSNAFFSVGYDLTVISTDDVKITPTKFDDPKYMPRIICKIRKNVEFNFLYLDIRISYPDMNSSEFEYLDSIVYNVARWVRIARVIRLALEWKYKLPKE